MLEEFIKTINELGINIYFTCNHKIQIEFFLKYIKIKLKKNTSELLKSNEIQEILNNINLDHIQKGKKIFACLRQLCYPEQKKYKELSQKLSSRLSNQTGIRLDFPKNLEGNFVTLNYKNISKQEIKLKLMELIEKNKLKFLKPRREI